MKIGDKVKVKDVRWGAAKRLIGKTVIIKWIERDEYNVKEEYDQDEDCWVLPKDCLEPIRKHTKKDLLKLNK